MSSLTVEKLVTTAKNGDADAFGELYALYARDLYRFALYYTGSPTLAQDAVGDAVLSAFENLPTLRQNDRFKPWLFKILLNQCKKTQKEKAFAARLVSLNDLTETPAEEHDMNVKVGILHAMLELSEEERETVLLSFVSGYTSREISRMTGEKDTTIRSRLSRAAAKLRKHLT
ncbi:MAG: RNA polymerase sigma factor [Oscillospiraceae bacterium]|nr:RNA polymerase sigma factor [Oscillospiraceae bacterium]MDD6527802.1 RNA polymerase sigma factor [Oscillospiraceae bacterium]